MHGVVWHKTRGVFLCAILYSAEHVKIVNG